MDENWKRRARLPISLSFSLFYYFFPGSFPIIRDSLFFLDTKELAAVEAYPPCHTSRNSRKKTTTTSAFELFKLSIFEKGTFTRQPIKQPRIGYHLFPSFPLRVASDYLIGGREKARRVSSARLECNFYNIFLLLLLLPPPQTPMSVQHDKIKK
jgi:hypothetical protein